MREPSLLRRRPFGFDQQAEAILVPELFTSLKAAIDDRRTAGRFILTGSANVLLVPTLADSLAGRMGCDEAPTETAQPGRAPFASLAG